MQNRIILNQFDFQETVKFSLHGSSSDRRKELEKHIADKYFSVYKAKISHFLPLLLTLDSVGSDATQTLAVTGLNPAAHCKLFLENYLDNSIEQAIARVEQQPIYRETVIEIGNLAVTRPGIGLLQFIMMTAVLHNAGFRWSVFTATPEVEKQLSALGFSMKVIGQAYASRLSKSEQKEWGDYFSTCPRIMVGSVQHGLEVISDSQLLLRAQEHLHDDIFALSNILSEFSQY